MITEPTRPILRYTTPPLSVDQTLSSAEVLARKRGSLCAFYNAPEISTLDSTRPTVPGHSVLKSTDYPRQPRLRFCPTVEVIYFSPEGNYHEDTERLYDHNKLTTKVRISVMTCHIGLDASKNEILFRARRVNPVANDIVFADN